MKLPYYLLVCCLLVSCGGSSFSTVTKIISGVSIELDNHLEVSVAGIEGSSESKRFLIDNILNKKIKIVLDQGSSRRNKKYVYISSRDIGSVNRKILLSNLSPLNRKTCSDSLHIYNSLVSSTLKTVKSVKKDRNPSENQRQKEPIKNTNNNIADVIDDIKENVFLIISYDEQGTEQGIGTGFFINDKGLAVSNYHVFEGGKNHRIKLDGDRLYNVDKIYAVNQDDDYLIFGVNLEGRARKGLLFTKTRARIGDDIYVLGNPKGLETTLSKGIVSSLRTEHNLIQIDAAISPGSSGSPVLNASGEVLGVATFKRVDCENCNFAVDIDLIKRELKQLK